MRTVALAALMALGLTACSSGQKVKRADEGVQEYVIGREDVLDISVWRDGDLSRTIPVRPDGKVSLPLIGELQAEGRTA
ncbi:MAG: polysaccharide biosynthesis/export family protein, partial [Myxococcales bacterium]